VYEKLTTDKILPKPAQRGLISTPTIEYSIFIHAPLDKTSPQAMYFVFPRLDVQ
jgi:hypothetical protein